MYISVYDVRRMKISPQKRQLQQLSFLRYLSPRLWIQTPLHQNNISASERERERETLTSIYFIYSQHEFIFDFYFIMVWLVGNEMNALPCYPQSYREPDSLWFIRVVKFTSRGKLLPLRLCSEPSAVALHRPQWNVILPTLNLDLSPPPLMKYWPFRLITTEKHDTHTHKLNDRESIYASHVQMCSNCSYFSFHLFALIKDSF